MLQRSLVALSFVLACTGVAEPQIFYEKLVGGKKVSCVQSGLTSNLKDCGVRRDSYTYVFIGSISAITDVENDEKELRIAPEEVFSGQPETPVIVKTSQAQCLPELVVGDRWLFYLRKDKSKPILLDSYGHDSSPIEDAAGEIETLRELQVLGDYGILRGAVINGTSFEGTPVPDAQVVARRASDGTRFSATTDSSGRYEFPPLLPGKYDLSVHPVDSFQPDADSADIKSGDCWDLTLTRSPHAALSGHLKRPDGSPASEVDVLVTTEDGSEYSAEKTDAQGSFHVDSLRAGKYVVGIDLPGAPAWRDSAGADLADSAPVASYYYPGVRDRSSALVITLATDEKRDDLEMVVPAR